MATNRGVVPHITLIDFGSARFTPIGGEVMMDMPAGSIDFVGMYMPGVLIVFSIYLNSCIAPEIVNNKPVSVATDMWYVYNILHMNIYILKILFYTLRAFGVFTYIL